MTAPESVRERISPEMLRQLLDYNPETGKFYWRKREASHFPKTGPGLQTRSAGCWNARFAGTEAFVRKNRTGYHKGPILSKTYTAHRVAWAIYYGEWPADQIDHINGDRADNRIANLRCVSGTLNMRNQKLRRGNTSGVTGVRFNTANRRWEAFIRVDYRHLHLGSFHDKEAAVSARKAAELAHGFHPNHGSPLRA